MTPASQPLAPYLEDVTGLDGVLPPRAAIASDAGRLCLNGSWAFRLSPSVAAAPSDAWDPAIDDAGWDRIEVPGHWQLQGFGRPAYTNIVYPFPLDPPHVPTENPTGDHRTRFRVPAEWHGGRVRLRFEGVDSCAAVWLNGQWVGATQGSRLPTEFDVTELLAPGENLLTVRVHQWSAGSYLEDQDMWWLSGIFRDVSLLHRPDDGLDDVRVDAEYDHVRGVGSLRVTGTPGAELRIEELGFVGVMGERYELDVEPWSAEVPRRYELRVIAPGESATLPIGFRSVAIEDGELRVNGRRIEFAGVNRHEFDPDRGRAVRLQTMERDVLEMKRHHINAVRTSHYPPHPAFLELCDRYGLWVIDECDLETHGFVLQGWRDNPVADPRFTDGLVQRMRRLVARDRNHPSIVMWSLGNESDTGVGLQAMYDEARRLDPSRPLHYENDTAAGRHSDVFSQMYTSHADVELIGQRAEPARGEDPEQDARRRAQPFLLCEYGHAMGTGPGGLTEYQELFERYPRCQGGFIWEWIDQGIRVRDADGREHFAYGGDFGEELHDGNFVCDGLMFPDRTASPGLVEFAAVIAPARFTFDPAARSVAVENRRVFADLSDWRFVWRIERDGIAIADGELPVGAVAAGGTTPVSLPLWPADGEVLTVEALSVHETAWAMAGHVLGRGQWPAGGASMSQLGDGGSPVRGASVGAADAGSPVGGALVGAAAEPDAPGADAGSRPDVGAERPGTLRPAGDAPGGPIVIGGARFDAETGTLLSVAGLEVSGPELDLWRAPTDNDERGLMAPTFAWRAAGLDRLHHRLVSLEVDAAGDGLTAVVRTAAAGQGAAHVTTYRWSADGDALRLRLAIEPEGDWPFALPRVGLRMAMPAGLDRVAWLGFGPGESYPDMRRGAWFSRFEASVDELQVPRVRPQENGHRSDARWVELRRADGTGLRVDGAAPFGFTARRWTSEDLDKARHTTDLAPRDRVFVTWDLAVHGLGTGACGPVELPQYTLRAAPREAEFTFRPLAP